MKTTVELPDQLFRQAKATALFYKLTLKELFIRSLSRELKRLEKDTLSAKEASAESPKWHQLLVTPSVEVLEELDQVDRVVNEEFSSIDQDSWR